MSLINIKLRTRRVEKRKPSRWISNSIKGWWWGRRRASWTN